MNCANCNTPLEPHTRFCPKCGATINQFPPANPSPLYKPTPQGESPTIPPTRQQQPAQWPPAQQQQPAQWPPAQQQQPAPGQIILSPSRQPPQGPIPAPVYNPANAPGGQQAKSPPQGPIPAPVYNPANAPGGQQAKSPGHGSIPAPVYNPANAPGGQQAKPPRRRRRILLPTLITLLVIIIVLVGGWFLGVRPYIDSVAQTKLNNALSQAVDNIPAEIALLPSGKVPVSESAINLLLSNQASSSDIVQNATVTITAQNFIFNFQVFGFSCSVTGVPIASNGKIVVTNVAVSGIAGLVLSPDELTTIVNKHLADAVTRINHPIKAVELKSHEIDLTFGARGGNNPPVSPTGVPTTIPTSIPTGIPTSISTLIP